ncbi:MAG: hypothetical protein HQK87_04860 [Nitrospinae bacterium]|nr:hypothetical protein [Nitrospinota bacterium]
MRDWLAGLRAGLFHEGIALLLMGGVAALLTPTLIERAVAAGLYRDIPFEYLARDRRDDDMKVAHDLARIKGRPAPPLGVYVLGGSGMREAVESEASLEEAIREVAGLTVEAHALVSPFRTFASCIAVVDNLPEGRGVVVIGVTGERFIRDVSNAVKQLDGRSVPVKSPILGAILQREAPEAIEQYAWLGPGFRRLYGDDTILTGIYQYARGYFRKRDPGLLLKGRLEPIDYVVHRYEPRMEIFNKKRHREALLNSSHLPDPTLPRYGLHVTLLEELIALTRSKGYTPLLVEQPMDARFIGASMEVIADSYAPAVRKVARETGVPYVETTRDLDLPSHMFGDLTHISWPEGRKRFERQVAEAIAELRLEVKGSVAPK